MYTNGIFRFHKGSYSLHSLERLERVMVRWMCRVSLKDRKHSVDLYSLLGVQSMAEVVRQGRLRWFGHVERNNNNNNDNLNTPGSRTASSDEQ